LVGHADDTPPSEDQAKYDNNREVSEARIEQVRLEILRRLERADTGRSKNVEWLRIPLSSESQFLDENRPYRLGDREPRLSVEVDVLPSPERVAPEGGRAFELLDYIYFTFYTITTTGFGDIIPVSPFTKFVATIADLFEVVFIVIFFNVLVSFLRDGCKTGTDEAGAAG
jgi:hypothetical protein